MRLKIFGSSCLFCFVCYLFFFFILLAVSRRPLTNYYQYSLGVLSLCVSSVRVNTHVSHKLIVAADQDYFKLGEAESTGELKLLIPDSNHFFTFISEFWTVEVCDVKV